MEFNNAGSVVIQAGTFSLSAGGTNSGAFNTAAGATTRFDADYILSAASALTGLGSYLLNAGTLTASGILTVTKLDLSSGALAGTQTFDNSTLNWTGTNLGTSGITTVAGTSTLNITSTGDHFFATRALVNNGTTNWSGGGALRGWSGASFTNNNVFNDQNAVAASAYSTFDNSISFTNAGSGVYTKSGAGTTSYNIAFTNAGAVNVQAGTFVLAAGGSNTGAFTTSSGATTRFDTDYTLAAASSLTGLGTYQLAGGTLSANGNLTVTTLNLAGGSLAGTQTFNNSTLNWTGTNLGTGGTTTIAGTSTLNITTAGDHLFATRALVNNGTANWSGGGALRGWSGASLTNNNLFNDQNTSAVSLYPTFDNSIVFTNAISGTYTKSGNATTTFSIGFNNAGTVNIQAGTLSLSAGGTNTGSFATSAGATTQFDTDYTLATGSSLTGLGTYSHNAGTLSAAGNITVTQLNLAGGSLGGTQTFNNSTLNWIGTNLGTSGTTTIAGTSTLNITTAGDHTFSSRALINNGVTNWAGGGALRGWSGASFTNNGQFNDQNATAVSFYPTYDNNFFFTNALGATYTKSGAGSTTFVDVTFTNAGTISVQGGTLSFNYAFSNNNGSIAFLNNASLVSPNAIALGTGALTGTGTLTASTVTAGGLVSPGASPGTLTITGNLTLLATATSLFEIGGTTPGTQYDTINVSGLASLDGTLQLTFVNGFAATVQSTDTFTLINAASLTGTFSNLITTGLRLNTTDGLGSFQVNYTGLAVTLSNFAPVPEPSTYALLVLGLGALFLTSRRRRRA